MTTIGEGSIIENQSSSTIASTTRQNSSGKCGNTINPWVDSHDKNFFSQLSNKIRIQDPARNISNHDSAVVGFTIMTRTAEEVVVEAMSLLPQYGSYCDIIPLAQYHTTEEMIRKYLCHDTLDTDQFGHLLPQRTRTQICISCPLHWNSQDLCVACTVDRVERKWNLKLYLDAIAMHKEWHDIILASDPRRVEVGKALLEIEIRLWWLQERVAFVQMEVERLTELREYQLYFWDANEPKDVVFPPWIPQFAGTKSATRYDGRNAGYPSSLASWFR